mgnify:CR=1 FL=1|jgi:hypothetical protein|tara:strand:+ start:80 stop:454 length:375 start_codon:yes stop_codon:yes gene_type:complete
MKITITEQQLKILTERNLTDNSPNIGVGGTMALIGVRTVPTEEKNELEEEKPLDNKCPSGCYCRGGECVKVSIIPGERPINVKCGKKCVKKSSSKTAKEKTIRRSDMDRSRRRPYSPSARFRAS